MIKIKDKALCCGCGACEQCCPRHCITLLTDEEGFAYPAVNHEKCVDCHLCERVCPVLNADRLIKNDPAKIETYVAYCNDEDLRLKSSSGGLFTVLAEKIIEEGGVVFGAAFDENFLVHHIKAEKIEELFLLRGSKYLQSRTEDCYCEARSELKKGRKVLYTGTACQIAGLYAYLDNEYENLLTVDVLCHGVPSPKVWRRYLDEQESAYGAAVRRTFFRSKNCGWKTYALSLEFSNDKAYECVLSKDTFMQMFLRNICLRPSCYICKFKGDYINSDITIGDAWGIQAHSPEMDDDKGTSVIVVHSSKGAAIFQSVISKLRCKKSEPSAALAGNPSYYQSVSEHAKRKKFFYLFEKGAPTSELVKLTKPSYFRIFFSKGKCVIKKILGK